MKNDLSTERMKKRYGRLTARLSALGPVLQGTITERTIERPDPGHPGKNKTYGPYFQWTFKQHGKTVTTNLTASQAKVYQKAIDQHRKLEATLEEMRTLSLQILEKSTQGVAKRKKRD